MRVVCQISLLNEARHNAYNAQSLRTGIPFVIKRPMFFLLAALAAFAPWQLICICQALLQLAKNCGHRLGVFNKL